MPISRSIPSDHPSGLDIFAEWVISEVHFGALHTSALLTDGHLSSARLQGTARQDLRAPVVSSSETQALSGRSLADVGTQTATEVAPAGTEPTPHGESERNDAPPAASGATASAQTSEHSISTASSAYISVSEVPANLPVELAAGPVASVCSPADPATASEAPAPSASAEPLAPTTPSAEPAAAPAAVPSARSYGRSGPRSRSQVGRDSYKLLWREYLALTQQNRHQLQAAGSKPGRGRLLDRTSSIGNDVQATGIQTGMSAPATHTIMQGPLPYDKPKGLTAVILPLLCPPTDFIDLQRLIKQLIRVIVAMSSWIVALSFADVPAWLWLIRHELLEGHRGDAAVVLVAGLFVFLAADWVRGAAGRDDSAHRAGMFKAGTQSASQLTPARYLGSSTVLGKSAGGPASSPLATLASGGVGGGRGPSSTTRSNPAVPANGAFGSLGPMEPQIRQVKQRIIKLERLLFGNELTEADISRETLVGRVQMLCTEVGVPFGGPGGSSTRPSAAELDQQLRAVESALGVP